MYDLSNVAVFAKVAETKSFTKTAHAFGLTPSSVSRRISKLEQAIGVQLFIRSTRHMQLTDAGEIFFEGCARGIREIEGASDLINHLNAIPRGALRVCLPPCFGRLHVVPLVRDFLNVHAHVEVEIILGYSEASMIGKNIDILIRSAVLPDSSLDYQDLAPTRHVACASPAYLERHGIPHKPKDLTDHNCLVLTEPSPKTEWHFVGEKRDWHVHVGGNFRANTTDVLYGAVMDGIGIARIPDYVVGPELKDGRLLSIFAEAQNALSKFYFPETTIKAYYARSEFTSPKIMAFLSFLRERFSKNPSWYHRPAVF